MKLSFKSVIAPATVAAIVFYGGLSQANESIAQNIQAAPEYSEIDSGNGVPTIFKRDIKAEANIKAASCLYFSNSVYGGPTAVNTFNVAYGPYTSNCSGVHTGTLSNQSSAWLQLHLEKLVSGIWKTVSNSTYTSYSGTPGTYRWTVWNTGNGTGYWKLDYNVPN